MFVFIVRPTKGQSNRKKSRQKDRHINRELRKRGGRIFAMYNHKKMSNIF